MSIHLDTVPALSDRQTDRQTERIGKKISCCTCIACWRAIKTHNTQLARERTHLRQTVYIKQTSGFTGEHRTIWYDISVFYDKFVP